MCLEKKAWYSTSQIINNCFAFIFEFHFPKQYMYKYRHMNNESKRPNGL